MIVQDLNFYSLLVPILMFIMGMSVLVFHRYQALPKYLYYYAYYQIGIGSAILVSTILDRSLLLGASAYICALYFISCALHLYAIHMCYRIRTKILPLVLLISSSSVALYYFSVIDNRPEFNLWIVSITNALIYMHHACAILKRRSRHFLDHCLKALLLLLLVFPIARGSILYLFDSLNQPTALSPSVWASTQFMLIMIGAMSLAIFIGYAVRSTFISLRKQCNLDPLTGLQNRRALAEQLEQIRSQPITQNALLICDLDHFKRINDQYGHYVGDLALKHVSNIMMKSLRQDDEISRFGGEEFIIILHDTQISSALQIAERIRLSIANQPLVFEGQDIRLTMSIGLSFFHFYSEFEDTLQQADQLLYQAKAAGRNNIRCAMSS